jgi:hypothetical protein
VYVLHQFSPPCANYGFASLSARAILVHIFSLFLHLLNLLELNRLFVLSSTMLYVFPFMFDCFFFSFIAKDLSLATMMCALFPNWPQQITLLLNEQHIEL